MINKYEQSRNPLTLPEDLDLLSKEDDDYICMNVAKHANTSEKTLLFLTDHKDVNVRRFLVRDNINVLLKLFNDSNKFIRENVVNNKIFRAFVVNSNSPDLLTRVSKSDVPRAKNLVAQNRFTPVEILVKLSKSPEVTIRECIAGNTSTPIPILKSLASDTSTYVIDAVLENPKTTLEILEFILNRFPKQNMFKKLISNHVNCSLDILMKLSNDEDDNVVYFAKQARTNRIALLK